jgi:hypothetical protein
LIYGELKLRREKVFPALELMGELGDDGWKLMSVESDAGVPCIEKVVCAVEKATH